ncbi:MAG: hypothetical protein QOI50_3429, partial [Pseudonocardiales bacterium]|nr:hypothetical protein [Pseudonocardiales bacterium]
VQLKDEPWGGGRAVPDPNAEGMRTAVVPVLLVV